jgi:hypothetical protein
MLFHGIPEKAAVDDRRGIPKKNCGPGTVYPSTVAIVMD